MNGLNIFEEHFRRVTESSEHEKDVHSKLIEGVIKLGNAQKTHYQKQKELADIEAEIAVLKSKNCEMKVTMFKALIERDELLMRQGEIESNVERLNNQLDNMNRESDDLLKGDEVNHICERFAVSEQISLLNRIQDNRSRLIKNGFPLHFFA